MRLSGSSIPRIALGGAIVSATGWSAPALAQEAGQPDEEAAVMFAQEMAPRLPLDLGRGLTLQETRAEGNVVVWVVAAAGELGSGGARRHEAIEAVLCKNYAHELAGMRLRMRVDLSGSGSVSAQPAITGSPAECARLAKQ